MGGASARLGDTFQIELTATEGGARGATWGWVSVVCCLVGLGTKEVMAAAPLLVLL